MALKHIKHPELFQGSKKKNNYFEGWYFKFVSKKEESSIAFIPGVSINKKDPHSFIQVFISKKDSLKTHYFKFPLSDFTYNKDEFKIDINDNHFEKDYVRIHLTDEQTTISATFDLNSHTPIKTNFYQPNIMGPFAYLNFMECYHGIVSMRSVFSGHLTINQETTTYKDEVSYIEKDWGKSFPSKYIWLQSNHFKNEKTSFMFSYAVIPFKLFFFKGLIVNLIYDNKEYRFSTYNRSKIKIVSLGEMTSTFKLKKGKYTLEVTANKEKDAVLVSPSNGQMINTIKEGLSGTISLKLYHKNTLLYEDLGKHAGIELMWI